jgi:hypothetical protein
MAHEVLPVQRVGDVLQPVREVLDPDRRRGLGNKLGIAVKPGDKNTVNALTSEL